MRYTSKYIVMHARLFKRKGHENNFKKKKNCSGEG